MCQSPPNTAPGACGSGCHSARLAAESFGEISVLCMLEVDET